MRKNIPSRRPQLPNARVDALSLATQHFHAGRFADTIRCLERVCWGKGAKPRARVLLAAAYIRSQNIAAASTAIERAVKIDGEHAELLSLRGLLLKAQGRLNEALEVFRDCRLRYPDHFDGLHNGGVVACQLAEFEEAEEFARGALELSPKNLEALKSLARVLVSVRRAGEARAVFEQLQQAGGRQGDVQNGIGACFLLDNQPLAAIPCLDAALEDDPNNGTTWANRGIALKALGRYPEALESLQQAVRVAPDNAENLWNLSLAQLATGDYAGGWANYEIRFAPQRVALDRVKLPATTIPQLMPGQDVNGKVVAVLAEQGLGDFIQFCRYGELLHREGAKVVLICPEHLVPLAHTLPWAEHIGNGIPRSGSNIDFYIMVMSLPHRCGTTVASIPSPPAYLAPTHQRMARWEPRLKDARRKVGIVWAGRPTHGNDYQRSTRLDQFGFLRSFQDRIKLFSLQMGERADDAAPDGLELDRLGAEIVDFGDSAAAVAHLDLLISIDSAPVHLAGALGRPCWVLLSKSADFRWLTDGETTPWYPSLRLFRQHALGDWDSVFERVAQGLEDWLSDDSVASLPAVTPVYDVEWKPGEFVRAGVAAQLSHAVKAQQSGDHAAAVQIYEWVLKHEPAHQDSMRNLAVAYRVLGRVSDSQRIYGEAMQLFPRDPILLTNFCNLASDLGDYAAVQRAAAVAVEEASDNAGAWYMLALAADRLVQGDGGLAAIERAVALAPKRVDYMAAHAVIVQKQGDFERSEQIARDILQIKSDVADAWLVMAQCYCRRRDYERGLEAYARAEALKPDSAPIWINRAVVFSELGRHDEAISNARRGIELAPDNPEGHFNLSLLLLANGDYERGWKEYRWRLDPRRKPRDRVAIPALRKPMWAGEPVDGKTVFLMPEQGLGDWIQFVRYAALLKQRGARVCVAVHKPLHRLFEQCPHVDRVYLDGEPLHDYDYWAFPLSLPEYLGTEPAFEVSRYLSPPQQLVGEWGARIDAQVGPRTEGKPRIGVVWGGRPTHPRDAVRSIPVEALAPLLLDSRYDWVALQHGEAYAQAYRLGDRLVHNLGKAVNDLADTAAILRNLDLLVSIDSAPVHLAGAMGLPCWVLLDAAPDWRWGRIGGENPWYPNMRLFRQPVAGDWAAVISRVAVELEGML